MNDEVELINDGTGLAVIGDPAAVERFLSSTGLPSRELDLHRLRRQSSGAASALAQAAADGVAQSGRWVKLTKESAEAAKNLPLMKGSKPGVGRAIVTENGKIKSILEIAKGPGALAANPALLAGAAGIMAQVAMQQAMDEVTDYLAKIDEKVDDILRAQKDAVFADMIGVDLALTDALRVRENMGRVPDTTWQKVQHTSVMLDTVQAYALRQLDAVAEKLEGKSKMGDLAAASEAAKASVGDWLAVVARCFQLQDAHSVLELDRVLEATPGEIDDHRTALALTREARRDLIKTSTTKILSRMDDAAERANSNVLLHPLNAHVVVDSRNQMASGVTQFHGHLGIESAGQALESKRWSAAALEIRDKAIDAGESGIDGAKRLGDAAVTKARSAAGEAALAFAERIMPRSGSKKADDES
ncbi:MULTISPECIES: hypothetical protein [unclassified Curtobacterium]|uniref:hypothetical protein n=1 Tax=unclassified Curtobacterium TaxID=257496 RepID=UPI000DA7CBAE|nr:MULTISPECIES: hypothetical protein [unclassified Curtobacterium]WIB64617.1 hypothetical protein DEI94_05360 [Curtobacterium sp. MCBD17_040]WIB68459.1 hypothetical protein DEI93_05330 [Curtobacterium sp. MCBD17_035]